jgi:hypothetical protein
LACPRSDNETATQSRHLRNPKRPVRRAINVETFKRSRKIIISVNVGVNVVADGVDMDSTGLNGYLNKVCGPRHPSAYRGGHGRIYFSSRPKSEHAGFWNGDAIRTRVAGAGAVLSFVYLSRPFCSARPDRPRPADIAERL